ncbi:hypothetical protein FDG50_14245 [Clostridium botulinum]|uniref:hypothetical protein n=1 Tax=Clostridium botulinum TaxID=1491 RepID=UPI00077468C5|nr:hypothetical protein [Clostridium botulinum]MBN1042083.1 hypothetical protein [Clostridium botulinum]MBY6838092.1 hypothetical protein [Clostridium botulinum]MBY6916142.1 hypothetical protein [Clostridium botulinum]NFE96480.1 hypothetical protein [Clostridium botulinum]NFG27184.1 hypothetical protein [Clostridium botulinum]
MIKWEFKKLIKSKGMMISLAVLIFTLLSTSFINPVLETENSYLDDKEGYVQDTRDTLEIANEKFHMKISVLEELSNQKSIEDNFSKTITSMSKEKISNLISSKYEDVGFWQVFNYRATSPLINISMLIIIMIIISNLYTDEIISSVKDIILSSKKKNKVLNSKIIMALLIPIIVYSVYLLGIFIITYIQKGAPINGELEAFRIVDNITILNGNPTIITYILSNIKIAFLMFEGWAVASMLFSFISMSSISSISMLGVFIVLSKVVSILKFMPGAILSVFSNGNYYDLIFNFNNLIGSYIGSVNIFGTDFGVITLVKWILAITFIVLTALCFVISRTKYINR